VFSKNILKREATSERESFIDLQHWEIHFSILRRMQFIKTRNKYVPKPSFLWAALLMTLMPADGRELHASSLLEFSHPQQGRELG